MSLVEICLFISNIFGTRVKRFADNAPMISYVLHRGSKQSQAYRYSTTVHTGILYFMRGEKGLIFRKKHVEKYTLEIRQFD